MTIKWYELSHKINGAEYDITSYKVGNADQWESAAEWVQQVKLEFRIAAGDDEMWEIYEYPHRCHITKGRCNCRVDNNIKPMWSEKVSN